MIKLSIFLKIPQKLKTSKLSKISLKLFYNYYVESVITSFSSLLLISKKDFKASPKPLYIIPKLNIVNGANIQGDIS